MAAVRKCLGTFLRTKYWESNVLKRGIHLSASAMQQTLEKNLDSNSVSKDGMSCHMIQIINKHFLMLEGELRPLYLDAQATTPMVLNHIPNKLINYLFINY